jgi:hypothetical protein
VVSLAPGFGSGSCLANCAWSLSTFFRLPKTWLALRGVRLGMSSLDAMSRGPSDAVGDDAEFRFESPEPSRDAGGLDRTLTSS